MDLSNFFPFVKLTAGDSWKWEVYLPQYSAASWSLLYTAKSADVPVKTFSSVASTSSNTVHSISIIPATTATYPAGSYLFSVSLLGPDGEKITLGSKTFDVLPDLATVPDNYEHRTYNKQCLDKLAAVLFKNASRDTLETVFKDATVKYKSYGELLKLYTYFETRVNEENGIKAGRIIYNRI